MTTSRPEAYYTSCQGSTFCLQLLPQITPDRVSFIWPLITIISPNLPQSTLWKSIDPKRPTSSFFFLLRTESFIVDSLLQNIEPDCTKGMCSIHMAECQKGWPFQTVQFCWRCGVRKELRETNTLIMLFFKAQCSRTSVARSGGQCSLQYSVKSNTLQQCTSFCSSINSILHLEMRSKMSLTVSSVPGMPDPVSYHPLLTGTSLYHKAKTKVGIFGHLHFQTPTRISVDNWAILQQKPNKNKTFVNSKCFLKLYY